MKKILLLSILALTLLCACLPATDKNEVGTVQGRIAQNLYFVPSPYLFLRNRPIANDTIFVLALHPTFAPALEPPQALLKKDQWWRAVKILAKYQVSPASIQALAASRVATSKATLVVGTEYGLTHQTQPENEVQDHDDIWLPTNLVEGASEASFVVCDDLILPSDVPQCDLYFYRGHFYVQASFDKRLLPEWQSILVGTKELLASFEDEEQAHRFFKQSLE